MSQGEDYILLGKIEEMEEEELYSYKENDMEVVYSKIGSEVFVVEDNCSHKDCALSDGFIEGEAIMCPCHGGQFDMKTGEVLVGPPVVGIKSYETIVADGKVYIKR